ncbi:putative DNA-directed DNA polymerase [Dioscorea sansibarensis]
MQIQPVVSSLCASASILGTSPSRLADCLGLDSSKYQYNVAESAGQSPTVLSCPCCSGSLGCA